CARSGGSSYNYW
nr:immunoglobulin heavy chain junction region [Mus musculus]